MARRVLSPLNQLGGVDPTKAPMLSAQNPSFMDGILDGILPGQKTLSPGAALPPLATPGIQGGINMPSVSPVAGAAATKGIGGVPLSGGDITGMLGNAIGGITPMLTTLANGLTTPPNTNEYEGFGEDALTANANAKAQLAAIRDSSLESVGLKENTARARNRNSASSVSTLRALDFATDEIGNQAENDVMSSFANQLMGQFNQQAQLENVQDQVVMGGDQQADLADRQDNDSFYTNLSDNFANLGNAVQKQGKDMNVHAQNNEMLALMPQLSKYGLGYTYDEKGNPILSKI